MASKFHNSPLGPRKCTATVKPCVYGAEDHFDSQEAAQAAYEEKQAKIHGEIASMRKKARTPSQRAAVNRLEDRHEFPKLYQKLREEREAIKELSAQKKALTQSLKLARESNPEEAEKLEANRQKVAAALEARKAARREVLDQVEERRQYGRDERAMRAGVKEGQEAAKDFLRRQGDYKSKEALQAAMRQEWEKARTEGETDPTRKGYAEGLKDTLDRLEKRSTLPSPPPAKRQRRKKAEGAAPAAKAPRGTSAAASAPVYDAKAMAGSTDMDSIHRTTEFVISSYDNDDEGTASLRHVVKSVREGKPIGATLEERTRIAYQAYEAAEEYESGADEVEFTPQQRLDVARMRAFTERVFRQVDSELSADKRYFDEEDRARPVSEKPATIFRF